MCKSVESSVRSEGLSEGSSSSQSSSGPHWSAEACRSGTAAELSSQFVLGEVLQVRRPRCDSMVARRSWSRSTLSHLIVDQMRLNLTVRQWQSIQQLEVVHPSSGILIDTGDAVLPLTITTLRALTPAAYFALTTTSACEIGSAVFRAVLCSHLVAAL
jgi:hypothetical protein